MSARRRIGIAASADRAREPIAIVGMSGRYPQAANLEAYWETLQSGKDCIGELPTDRWGLEGFYHAQADEAVAQGKSYSKSGKINATGSARSVASAASALPSSPAVVCA